MNKSVMTLRKALLWLLPALAGGLLLAVVMPSGRTRSELAATAVCRGVQGNAVVPVAAPRATCAGREMNAAAPFCGHASETLILADENDGGETPFASDATDATAKADVAAMEPADAAALCAALRDACASGNGADLASIRIRLVAMGVEAIPALSDLLRCGNAQAEVEAVRLLVQIGEPRALAFVLGRLLAEPRDSATYGRLLAAFADHRSAAVAQWLVETLGKTQRAETRERLLDLVHAMRGPEAVDALEQAALDPIDDLHGQDALDAIAGRQSPSETDSLAALLALENAAVREAAAYGLAGIGSGESCDVLAEQAEALPCCAAALAVVSSSYAQESLLAVATDRSRSSVVRVSAVHALSKQTGYRVRTVLANAVVREPCAQVAGALQTALSAIDNCQTALPDAGSVAEGGGGETWF